MYMIISLANDDSLVLILLVLILLLSRSCLAVLATITSPNIKLECGQSVSLSCSYMIDFQRFTIKWYHLP